MGFSQINVNIIYFFKNHNTISRQKKKSITNNKTKEKAEEWNKNEYLDGIKDQRN